ncbi:MAG: DUF1254 domain-containing protein [Coprobacillus sp.]
MKDIKQAFIYGYPIVGMYELLSEQVLEKQLNINEFTHTAGLSTPETTFVPAPNNDTTYSRAWLDLRGAPVVIEVPDTFDRFYSIQLLDMFSETIENVGKRTTGTRKQRFVIVGPLWKGDIPEGTHIVYSQTVFVLAFLRILIQNQEDIKNVEILQKQIAIIPMSKQSLDTLPVYRNNNYKEFFETLQAILRLTPTLPQEQEIVQDILSMSLDHIDDKECDEVLKLIDESGKEFGEEVNYWRIAREGIGNYGNDYFQRAVVWYKGALANQPEESLYPSTFQDSEGNLLDGHNCYRLTFSNGDMPPVSQFWSLTMYIFENGFLSQNEINRYSIGDRTANIHYEKDGSLILYIQNQKPTHEYELSNWLPAPLGKFYMTLRLYGPSQDAVIGNWAPPAVIKVGHSRE